MVVVELHGWHGHKGTPPERSGFLGDVPPVGPQSAVGDDLEYADEVTLGRAFEGRRTVS